MIHNTAWSAEEVTINQQAVSSTRINCMCKAAIDTYIHYYKATKDHSLYTSNYINDSHSMKIPIHIMS